MRVAQQEMNGQSTTRLGAGAGALAARLVAAHADAGMQRAEASRSSKHLRGSNRRGQDKRSCAASPGHGGAGNAAGQLGLPAGNQARPPWAICRNSARIRLSQVSSAMSRRRAASICSSWARPPRAPPDAHRIAGEKSPGPGQRSRCGWRISPMRSVPTA